MSRVRVIQPTGEAFYEGAVADVFEGDVLTISQDEPSDLVGEERIETIQAGQWISATVYDNQGYVLYTLLADKETKE